MKIIACLTFCFLLLVSSVFGAHSPQFIPIVFWHGMGDSCCNRFSLGGFMDFVKEQMPTVFIHSIRIGSNIIEDTENGFFMNVNKQIDIACQQLSEIPDIKLGYNAVGFSQGGLFLRALAQRCPHPRILNLISLGGPQQGVYGLPHCLYPDHTYCDYVRRVLNVGAYWSWIQNDLVQAEYWHDPMKECDYKQGSIFLADVNNENGINASYVDNLKRLSKLVLVKFEADTMVEPKESEWFGFYTPGQAKMITPLQNSSLFLEERLGLKYMFENNRLDFLSVPGDHLRFTKEWFIKHIIQKYLI